MSASLLRLAPCAWSITRKCTAKTPQNLLISRLTNNSLLQAPCQRFYATKGKARSSETLVPGSQQPITDPDALQEYVKAEAAMKAAVDWFRKECSSLEGRAAGRVTPALLSPVRVKLPSDDKEYRLEEVATVGVKDGSALLVTVFQDDTLKFVERGIYDSQIQGITVHKHDRRTLKIPVPKPTVEARAALFMTAKRKAEEIRVQVRKQHQQSVRRGKYDKRSVEVEEFQKLNDRYIAEVDSVISNLQKATGSR